MRSVKPPQPSRTGSSFRGLRHQRLLINVQEAKQHPVNLETENGTSPTALPPIAPPQMSGLRPVGRPKVEPESYPVQAATSERLGSLLFESHVPTAPPVERNTRLPKLGKVDKCHSGKVQCPRITDTTQSMNERKTHGVEEKGYTMVHPSPRKTGEKNQMSDTQEQCQWGQGGSTQMPIRLDRDAVESSEEDEDLLGWCSLGNENEDLVQDVIAGREDRGHEELVGEEDSAWILDEQDMTQAVKEKQCHAKAKSGVDQAPRRSLLFKKESRSSQSSSQTSQSSQSYPLDTTVDDSGADSIESEDDLAAELHQLRLPLSGILHEDCGGSVIAEVSQCGVYPDRNHENQVLRSQQTVCSVLLLLVWALPS